MRILGSLTALLRRFTPPNQALKLYPISSVPMFFLYFLFIEKHDEHQLVWFIRKAKVYACLTSGLAPALGLASQFYDCLIFLNTVESNEAKQNFFANLDADHIFEGIHPCQAELASSNVPLRTVAYRYIPLHNVT